MQNTVVQSPQNNPSKKPVSSASLQGNLVALDQQLHQALKTHFNWEEFRPGQLDVVRHLIQGQSAAAVFPTGSGKSLCFQLPALMLDGLTLVVSPLIALMKDQIDALTARGINAARLDSTLSLEEYRQVMNDVRSGTLRLLYVAPERFNNERFRSSLSSIDIALFAIDEAHCISEWGHNFRPDYLKLVDFARSCGARRLLALTATATPKVLNDICDQFGIGPECAINTGFYRENLHLCCSAVTEKQRDQTLVSLLKEAGTGPSIVYVTLQKTAEQVANMLASCGFDAKHYHAGLKDDARTEIQDWFVQSSHGIVVATIAFGMGIDKSDIRGVYHYNLPKSLENYSQEIGRAGRDGKVSQCHLLLCSADLTPLENFVYGDTPTADAVNKFVELVFSHSGEFDISLFELSRKCDIRPLVLRTLLTKLELQGYLTGGTPFYASYQFKPLLSSAEILERFDPQRQAFIGNIFKAAVKKKTWFELDVADLATQLNDKRDRIVRALDYMAENNMLELKVAGVRNRYTVTKAPDSNQQLALDIASEAVTREEGEIARLAQITDWATANSCQSALLAKHFGEYLDGDCGHCGWCLNKQAVVMDPRPHDDPDTKIPALNTELLTQARALQSENSAVLNSETDVARVLCGLSSPAITVAKLQKSPLYGRCENTAFKEVLKALSGNK